MGVMLFWKNREAINELWDSLKKQIEKGSLYSTKWFEKADLDEEEEQEFVDLITNFFMQQRKKEVITQRKI